MTVTTSAAVMDASVLMNMRCKTALGLCALIVIVHMSVMAMINTNNSDNDSKDTFINSKKRSAASADQDQEEEVLSSGSRRLQEDNLIRSVSTTTPYCRSGQMQGLKPFCDLGCLPRLQQPHLPSFPNPRNNAVSLDARREITYMSGERFHQFHLSLPSHLTDIQWKNGIYGTVGQIGATPGKFTSVLGFNVDITAGEQLFVSGQFAGQSAGELSAHPDMLSAIKSNLGHWGWQQGESDAESERHYHLHEGTATSLNTYQLQQRGFSQFRLISIYAESGAVPGTVQALEQASCLLRDGGVIIVSGVSKQSAPATSALKHFFNRHGTTALSPLMSIKDKLYICTTNWKDRFTKSFKNDEMLRLAFSLKEVTSNAFGPEMVYMIHSR